ncbi:5-(carboxyamino)imidazole ribonucleotide synthase [Photobacterium sp. CCB-ST2H9]|uniref:5-(carboxyamino)imidazole ribonucleotide synthase n=1 Tax=unclassified Photobacterium TaxID=2628852 RepID=UPI00200575DF|nr:5-(carboxyamino)imidazole ribonucleotide synthase [Photobacterium sp. CCB-ST2H9]UTM57283.1 5-(carboxyamino)imidazole ribonucleotide synthase [Photobacterium sp. CCB-ST2H9]
MKKVLVLGAGQLARMMALAGAPLNIEVMAYDVNNGQVVHPLTLAPVLSGLNNAIGYADVITAEFEHVPHDVLDACEASGKLKPNAAAIKAGGDRRIEKALLDQAGVANARYQLISTEADLALAAETIGLPLVLKSALGGYDGKGQWRLKTTEQIPAIWQDIADFLTHAPEQSIVAEAFVPFQREVSMIGARNAAGDTAIYPLTENVHTDGVLSRSLALEEQGALQQQAEMMFNAVAATLDYVGVLAIEFFDVNGQLLINEIAPRVHNSGHWTQQGADTCQFENHLRAVCDLPLGSTTQTRSTVMLNILGEDTLPAAVLTIPGCHLHWYGKEKRPGRKMGHINVTAASHPELVQTLNQLAQILPADSFPVVRLG